MQLSPILVHAFVASLDKSKLDLDNSERVLDLGTDFGFERLKLIGDSIFCRVSQCASLPRLSIHPNMRLHSKVPVVALFGLVHIGVSRTGGILGRARRLNDRGIHNRALRQTNHLTKEVLNDQVKDMLSELIGLQQVPEVQNGRLIGDRATAQGKPRRSAHGSDLIECLFHRRVAKSTPLLHAVHPKHRRQGIGRSAHSRLGIHGLNQLDHRVPGRHRFHLGQEDLSLGLLALGPLLYIGETQLAHYIPLKSQYRLDHAKGFMFDNHESFSELP